MKNSNLFIKLSYLIPALLILCMINLKAQNELIGYTYVWDYAGHYYYLSNCEATWEEANEAATEMGGYLATFNDYNEIYYLTGPYGILAAYSYWSLYNYGELHGIWFGLRGENGIYEWANGEPSDPNSWNIIEPVYADGAAVMKPDWEDAMYYLASYPVSGETEYLVEFPYQPNCNSANKSYVCHNGNTICVNNSAVQAHLDHGDLAGPCGPCNSYAMQALPEENAEIEGHSLNSEKAFPAEPNEEYDVVQGIASHDIQISPNPASEEIQVVLPKELQEGIFRILSLTGQEMHSLPLQGQQSNTIDLSTYTAGMYLIDIRTANGHYQKKFVKL